MIDDAFLDILQRRPTASEVKSLEREDHSRTQLLLQLARSPEYAARQLSALDVADSVSDEAFVEAAYRHLLLREPDASGRTSYLKLLADGVSRQQVVAMLAGSDEHVHRVVGQLVELPDLRVQRAESYLEISAKDGTPVPCFHVRGAEDFDWLERAIIENGYYDKPGVWGCTVNQDKRVMAELIASLGAPDALDLGCANGTMIDCLLDLGVDAYGIELSAAAAARASARARDRIFVGDVADVSLPRQYSLVFGLDIFEHLNPNRLDHYLERVRAVMADSAFLVANIPAFGADRHFGRVYDPFLPSWEQDCAEGRPFSDLQVDERGYPCHGHLVWAPSEWWEEKFVRLGLTREGDIEDALHARYDEFFRSAAPARACFYVFSHGVGRERVEQVVAGVREQASTAVVAD